MIRIRKARNVTTGAPGLKLAQAPVKNAQKNAVPETMTLHTVSKGDGKDGVTLKYVTKNDNGKNAGWWKVKKTQPNGAGAKYGTGYCDAQCPKDIKWINGKANNKGWKGDGANVGAGDMGVCCPEMDIWEANSFAQAFTSHTCKSPNSGGMYW
ncbi:hypothetical protein PGT21_008674 [Puccinia graminis f. sp. tritici]|uniref:Glucanase n=1 Tax=Puccinia graminis f. sp. tritici TaxID=56615 RepID=A0A5B0QEP6_PUCGR|nr:hypothetical protein PGT21_008674 [Puccinia graminis f. sp. tritici]